MRRGSHDRGRRIAPIGGPLGDGVRHRGFVNAHGVRAGASSLPPVTDAGPPPVVSVSYVPCADLGASQNQSALCDPPAAPTVASSGYSPSLALGLGGCGNTTLSYYWTFADQTTLRGR